MNQPFALNADQRRAVEHGLDDPLRAGPLLVLAGAGTGKTATLAHRVASLVSHGVAPERILLLTFSRRAAAEMVRRAGALLLADKTVRSSKAPVDPLRAGDRGFGLAWAGTFHSVAAQLLRRHGDLLGLNPAFTILDRGDSVDCIDWLRTELAFDRSASRFPRAGTCLSICSDRTNTGRSLADILGQDYPWCVQWQAELQRLLRRYVTHKHDQALLDYDDLLLWWRLGMDEAEFAARVRAHFDHVLVDEYQDSNRLQVEVLTALCPDGRGLFVVGDDAQSIYSFRGADVRHIYRFSSQFSPPAARISLSLNYRSTQPVLDAANAVIAGAGGPFDKTLIAADTRGGPQPSLVTVLDDDAQSAWVIEQVLQQREAGVPLRHQAVLFRNAHHSDLLEVNLTRHNIPFVKYGGLKFVEAAHVKDAVAMMRWAVNTRDTLAAFRSLQLVPGVGPAIARRCLAQLATSSASAEPAGRLLTTMPGVCPRGVAAGDWSAFAGVLHTLADRRSTVPTRIDALADWLSPVIAERYDEVSARQADIRMLSTIGAGFHDMPGLLAALALDPPGATGGWGEDAMRDEDYLILSTVHSAKGQEWHNVMIINVADGNFPNEFATAKPAALDEERRLLYVAMTRARRHLHLIEPMRYYVTHQARLGGSHVQGARSRFLDDRVLATLTRTGQDAEPVDSPGSQDARVDDADLPGLAGAAPSSTALDGVSARGSRLRTRMVALWDDPEG